MSYIITAVLAALTGAFISAVFIARRWAAELKKPEKATELLGLLYENAHRHWLQVSKEDDTPACPMCGWVPNWRHRKISKDPVPEGMIHPVAKPKKPLSAEWTSEDRLRVVAALLPDLGSDIWQGRYSAEGRPNVTSLQHLIGESAAELEEWRVKLESAVALREDGDCRKAMDAEGEAT
jgi:hypothetical protein